MTPFKYINRYKIRDAMPGILTTTACIGVVATGVSSAYAMKRYIEKMKEPCDPVMEAIKSAAVPTLIGVGTIASFIFVRKADKAVIAGLSAAAASLGANVNETTKQFAKVEPDAEKFNKRLSEMDPDIIIDEDGEIFLCDYLELYFKVKRESLDKALYKLNRNFQLRGGLASFYEYLRLLGVKRCDIRDYDIEWTKYVGWNFEWLCDSGIVWIDGYAGENGKDGHNIFGFEEPPMPICCDPPRFVMDLCNVDEEDLKTICLSEADDILLEIEAEIMDKEVE